MKLTRYCSASAGSWRTIKTFSALRECAVDDQHLVVRSSEVAIQPHPNALPHQRRHCASRQVERLAAIGDDFHAHATRVRKSERASDSTAGEAERVHEHFRLRAFDEARKARVDRIAGRK